MAVTSECGKSEWNIAERGVKGANDGRVTCRLDEEIRSWTAGPMARPASEVLPRFIGAVATSRASARHVTALR